MFLKPQYIIINFALIFIVGIFISYLALTHTYSSYILSITGGALLGYSIFTSIKLYAKYITIKDKK